jgi:hypothetical protein
VVVPESPVRRHVQRHVVAKGLHPVADAPGELVSELSSFAFFVFINLDFCIKFDGDVPLRRDSSTMASRSY